jgi:hypothetical protein
MTGAPGESSQHTQATRTAAAEAAHGAPQHHSSRSSSNCSSCSSQHTCMGTYGIIILAGLPLSLHIMQDTVAAAATQLCGVASSSNSSMRHLLKQLLQLIVCTGISLADTRPLHLASMPPCVSAAGGPAVPHPTLPPSMISLQAATDARLAAMQQQLAARSAQVGSPLTGCL